MPGRRGLSRGGDTRRGVTVSHHHHLFHPPAADVMRLHEYSDEPKHMKDELDYIRQGLPQRTLKKTNLPMISDATSTIDSNLTAVAPEDLLSSRDYETIQDGKQMRSTRRYFMPRLAVAWDSIDASKDLPLEDHRKNT